MVLNIQKGNMYDWLNATWNPISGRCPQGCIYCFMITKWDYWKSKKNILGIKQILNEKTLNDDLGTGNFIFVGSSTDMFAKDVPSEWIEKVLEKCRAAPGNEYLFQSKNPERFTEFVKLFPEKTLLGTTIETNRQSFIKTISKAPPVFERAHWMNHLNSRFPIMVTIEPIFDFDLEDLVFLIRRCNPKWVNIGADSQGHKLDEPSASKLKQLIEELKEFTEVKKKKNLSRLMK